MKLTDMQRDRAVGALVGLAASDALDAGYEFGPPLPDATVEMKGDGMFRESHSLKEFPPRKLTEQTIVQILWENGGCIRLRDKDTGWSIYDDIACDSEFRRKRADA